MTVLSEMKPKSRNTLFQKYIRHFLFIELVTFVALGCVLCYFVSKTWETEQKQRLYAYAVNVGDIYAQYEQTENGSEHIKNSISGAASAVNADVFVTDSTGKTILCSDCSSMNAADCRVHAGMKIPGEIFTGILADGNMATKSNLGGVFPSEYFVSAFVVGNTTKNVRGIVFAVQPVDRGLTPYLARFLQIYIMAALVFVIVTMLITYVSTYSLTKPLRDIAKATHHYSEGDFSYRINCSEPSSVREFDDLSAAINSMAEDLQQFETSRSNFVANISHELKTPMTTIGGFVDGILDGTIDSEHQTQYLKVVSDEVKRLSRLVVSMLDMSKMEAGELRINPTSFNLTQQIFSIFISFEQKIENKDIDVKGLDHLKTVYIEADSDMINQVFYNLVDNAVKFTEKDGEISVQMTSDDEFVTFSIRNTGKAIASADIDHVFERFYKADKSRSMDAKSAGLGLFISKNIVELHNGEIKVRNIGDKYTEFSVKLKKKLINL